ncbi:MAG: hypothetical protein LBR98_10130 [Syntrophomonadaceae bacterium]|jgi:hypothetical protein|nr:hypothetical protein [Syntrophomonadaceae bacterium]
MSEKQSLTKTLVLAAAIIIASLIFAVAIKNASEYIGNAIGNGLNHIGNSVSATGVRQSFDEYMSEYEASAFLRINIDDFYTFVESGELNGTFTIIQGGRVFSKEELTRWLDDRIAN